MSATTASASSIASSSKLPPKSGQISSPSSSTHKASESSMRPPRASSAGSPDTDDDHDMSQSVDDDGDDEHSVGVNGRGKKKKKANRACAACQKAHLTCDDSRPCTRCVKKGVGDQCTDGKRKRAKYLLEDDELEAIKAREQATREETENSTMTLGEPSEDIQNQEGSSSNPDSIDQMPQSMLPPSSFVGMGGLAASGGGQGLPVMSENFSQGPLPPSDDTPPHAFGSEATSLEYSILSAMLNGIDPNILSAGADKETDFGDAAFSNQMSGQLDFANLLGNGSSLPSVGMANDVSSHWLLDQAPSSAQRTWNSGPTFSNAPKAPDGRPELLGRLHAIGGEKGVAADGEVGSGGFKALEVPSPSASQASNRLGLDDGHASSPSESGNASHLGPSPLGPTAARPPESAALKANWTERVHQIYRSTTTPFPYTEGYHFLLKFATERFEKAEVLRIVRALGLFRPSLIALQMPLTEEDEVFVERSIQRTILEFEKLIAFSGTPTVVWRRTCEICVVGSEFCMLTGWSRDNLLGRRVYEFWDKNSTLEYWEKFASHAFENTSQSIVANVVIKKPDGTSVPCAACFSIKRNVFDLPSLVVGAFLPILSST